MVAEQKLAMTGPEVWHVRFPLTAAPSFTVIPVINFSMS
jgi:hypothetical protein